MSQLQLDILTPARPVFSDACDDVYVPTESGEVGVLEAHENFVTLLGIGPVHIHKANPPKLCIRGGFLEIVDNKITLLADEVKFQNEIDLSELQEQVKQTNEKLTDAGLDVYSQQRLREDLRWLDAQKDLVSAKS